MATLRSQPASLCFSSAVDDIVFFTPNFSGSVLLTVMPAGGSSRLTLIDETLHADPLSGLVTISDLPGLLEPYARRYLNLVLQCSFTDDRGTASMTAVTILYAMADVGQSAADFTSSHFLTTLDGEKITAPGRTESLYAYGADKVTLTVHSRLPDGTPCEDVTGMLLAMATQNGVSEFNVGPDNVAALVPLPEGALITSYSVTAGDRKQTFRCTADGIPPAPSLQFVNSFGCKEFIHCVGTHKKDSKYERKQTRIMGRLRNYRIAEERQFTANTGWLNAPMADWADELLRSQQIWLWVKGSQGREVVITDSKSELSNEDDHMPAFEFTYVYAQRIHNVMQPSYGRIFDNTFDHTFN